jgi:hypothetical protein
MDVRITPIGESGRVGVSIPALGSKVGNDAPVLADVEIEGNAGRVVVRFTLRDSTDDICAVLGRFSLNGGAFQPLSPTAIVGGRTTGLVAAPVDQDFDFTWDTIREAAIGRADVNVVVELTATDEAGREGGTASTPPVALDNNAPPQAAISTPGRSVSGTVAVPYSLFDPDGDAADIAVTYVTEDGSRSGVASAAGGDGVADLPALPGGSAHTFVWAYRQDLGSNGAVRARLRIAPRSLAGEAGAIAESAVFVAGNDPPVATITSVPNPASGSSARIPTRSSTAPETSLRSRSSSRRTERTSSLLPARVPAAVSRPRPPVTSPDPRPSSSRGTRTWTWRRSTTLP